MLKAASYVVHSLLPALVRFVALAGVAFLVTVLPSSLLFHFRDGRLPLRGDGSDSFVSNLLSISAPIAVLSMVITAAVLILQDVLFLDRKMPSMEAILVDKPLRKRLLWAALAAAAIGVVAFILSVLVMEVGLPEFIDNPGGLFAIVTGLVSITALLLTLFTLIDIRSSISSFPNFIDRVEKLIDETPEDDYLDVCLHTPATGCLALPTDIWNRVSAKLEKKKKNFALVCLSDEEMLIWFRKFFLDIAGNEKREKEMKRRILEGMAVSQRIKATATTQDITPFKASRPDGTVPVHRLMGIAWNKHPGVYFVANRHRAIVVIPFYMPSRYQKASLGTFNDRVDMIGFETTDGNIVTAVHEELARIRDDIRQSPESWIETKDYRPLEFDENLIDPQFAKLDVFKPDSTAEVSVNRGGPS